MKIFVVEEKDGDIIKWAKIKKNYRNEYYIHIRPGTDNLNDKGRRQYLWPNGKLSYGLDSSCLYKSEQEAEEFLLAWIENNKYRKHIIKTTSTDFNCMGLFKTTEDEISTFSNEEKSKNQQLIDYDLDKF